MKLNIQVPTWLKPGLIMTDQEADRLTDAATNWVKLFGMREQLKEVDCLRLICLELSGKKRPDIISRVKHWYNVLRHDREVSEMWAGRDS